METRKRIICLHVGFVSTGVVKPITNYLLFSFKKKVKMLTICNNNNKNAACINTSYLGTTNITTALKFISATYIVAEDTHLQITTSEYFS